MTQFVLLYQLRERLRLVNERIALSETGMNDLSAYTFHAGSMRELRSEAAFLADLIADLEREGVQPCQTSM